MNSTKINYIGKIHLKKLSYKRQNPAINARFVLKVGIEPTLPKELDFESSESSTEKHVNERELPINLIISKAIEVLNFI